MKIKIGCKICGHEITDTEIFVDYENDQQIIMNVGPCEYCQHRQFDEDDDN